MPSLSGFDGWLRDGMKVLLAQHPRRVTIGICGGVVLGMLIDAFKAMIPATINVAAFTDFRLALAGIFVANAPVVLKRSSLPEDTEQMFTAVRLSVKEGNLTQAQTRALYIQVCHEVASKSRIATRGRRGAEVAGVRTTETEADSRC